MSASATTPRWSGHCVGCQHERELETRFSHAGRALCDECAAKPHQRPGAGDLVADLDAARAARAAETPTDGGLEQRLADARVDLVEYIAGGIPDREFLPQSERMLVRGKRATVAAPMKSGKSIGFEAHAVDMVAAGATVVIVDRENGPDEYARRLAAILADRPQHVRDAVRERLRYYAWPELRLTDGAALAATWTAGRVDLVTFDSTRTLLTSLSLDEDDSDDYAKFCAALIEPLFRAGIATIQLDNTGHADKTRGRGTSSKGDLADVVYTLKTVAPFDANRRGRIRLVRVHSRFGEIADAFTMELGGGHYGTFTSEASDTEQSEGFRPTALMERISRALEDASPMTSRDIRAIPGNNTAKDEALRVLIREGYVTRREEGRVIRHYSAKSYRQAVDPCADCAHGQADSTVPTVPNRAQGVPNRAHDHAETTVPTVPVSLRARGTGHSPNEIPLATPEQEATAERAARLLDEEESAA